MAKNKGVKKSVKQDKAFIVKNVKKSKTKAVTTNLKKLDVQAKANKVKLKESTEQANERFAALQDTVKQISAKDIKKKDKSVAKKSQPSTSVDMDEAAEEFAKL